MKPSILKSLKPLPYETPQRPTPLRVPMVHHFPEKMKKMVEEARQHEVEAKKDRYSRASGDKTLKP